MGALKIRNKYRTTVPYVLGMHTSVDKPEQYIAKLSSVCRNSSRLKRLSLKEAREFLCDSIDRGHFGLLEHVSVTVEIQCSRVASHQIVRHRVGASYLQESQRHAEPVAFIQCHKAGAMPEDCEEAIRKVEYAALECYNDLLDRGVPKELARYVLPGSTATRLIITMTLAAWRHFLDLRCAKDAQEETRELAKAIAKRLYEYCPPIVHGIKHLKYLEGANG